MKKKVNWYLVLMESTVAFVILGIMKLLSFLIINLCR